MEAEAPAPASRRAARPPRRRTSAAVRAASGARAAHGSDGVHRAGSGCPLRMYDGYPGVAPTMSQLGPRLARDVLVHDAHAVELLILELLEIQERVVRAARDAQQLVELHLHGLRIPVLGVLDQEDHEEGDDRGAGVDHELPRVREAEQRT